MWHWGDILIQIVDVNCHSLFLRKSCDTLESKLSVQWNVSDIHTAWCLKGTLWWWFLGILLFWCGGVTHLRALVGKLGPYDTFFNTNWTQMGKHKIRTPLRPSMPSWTCLKFGHGHSQNSILLWHGNLFMVNYAGKLFPPKKTYDMSIGLHLLYLRNITTYKGMLTVVGKGFEP
jgi:hypothetical protein